MPLPRPDLVKQPAYVASQVFTAQPQVELAHRLPPVPVVSVELAARAQADAGLALLGGTADAASVAVLATESQQQVGVGFQDNPGRGWQDVDPALMAAHTPKHAVKGTPTG